MKPFRVNIKFFGLAITIFALLAGNCFGQSITWQRILQGPYQNANDYGYASCRADGQNIYLLGSISNQRIYLLKINQFGDTIWTRIIGNSYSRGSAIVESDSGSCILTGAIENGQAFAIKVSKDGIILWQKYYGGNTVQIYDIIKANDNGYLLCGSDNPLNAIIVKVNSNGDLVWTKSFSAGYKINFQSLIENIQNEIILTGWKSESSSIPTYGLIFKVDQSGNYLWDTTFSFLNYAVGGRKIIKTNNGYAISGSIYVNKLFFLRTNLNGNIMYTHIFDSTYQKYDIGGFKMLSPDKFIVNYSQDSISGQIVGKIVLFDSLGIIKKYKTYTAIRQLTFGSITQLSDTGFIFCGTINNYANTFRDIFVIKSDTTLYAQPVIGINQNTNEVPINFNLFQNFPNPFNPLTNIIFEIPKDAFVIFKVYDILGKELFNIIEYKKAGSYNVKFDGGDLASGIYFYSLKSNGYKETKKMVLLK